MERKKIYINHIPAILLFENELSAREKGSILFFHGLGASKDSQVKELESLAANGFLAIGIDNVGHGERRYQDFEQQFSSNNPDVEANFQRAMYETAMEIPSIVDFLIESKIVNPDKIGITGISMGGFITYGALVIEKRFRAAVSILGSPMWKNNPNSPAYFPESIAQMPLLSLNAGADESVSPQYAREFHQKLTPLYQHKENCQYVEYPGAGHFMPENDWNDLWSKTLNWFHHHI